MNEDHEMRQVILNIRQVTQFMDPFVKIGAVGALMLVQYLYRMYKEGKLSGEEMLSFTDFAKYTDGKYDIVNLPSQGVIIDGKIPELDQAGVRYCIMPDLNKEDGYAQIAVYQVDKGKFNAWYERYLIGQMKGGEKTQKMLRNLTNGNTSVISIPMEGKETEVEDDFAKLGINYAKLTDLNVGDGDVQYVVANADMKRVEHWYKLLKTDLLKRGQEIRDMSVSDSMKGYLQTGNMTEEQYINTASEELRRANEKYEGQSPSEITDLLNDNENVIKEDSSSEFEGYMNDMNYIPITINKETLVEQMGFEGKEEFLAKGYFCCRVPGTWGETEQILAIPADRVFQADEGKTYIAFLSKELRPIVYDAKGELIPGSVRKTADELARDVFVTRDDLSKKAAKQISKTTEAEKLLESRAWIKAPTNPLLTK